VAGSSPQSDAGGTGCTAGGTVTGMCIPHPSAAPILPAAGSATPAAGPVPAVRRTGQGVHGTGKGAHGAGRDR
jgi:hypothetical protein